MAETLNGKNTIHELEQQAKNTKFLMDRLNRAYIGLTVDEIIRLALTKPEELEQDEAKPASRTADKDDWGW